MRSGRRRDGAAGPPSLLRRLTASLASVVVIVSLSTGAATVLLAQRLLMHQLDTQLRESVRYGAETGIEPPPADGLPGPFVGTVDAAIAEGAVVRSVRLDASGGSDLTAEQEAVLLALDSAGPETAELPGLGRYRFVTAEREDGTTLVLGFSTAAIDRTVTTLAASSAGVTAAGVLLAWALARASARKRLRPLSDLADVASEVSRRPGGAMDATGRRVPEAVLASSSELQSVGAAINRMLDRIDEDFAARGEMEESLRRFVADASHELRTPLASVRGYTELCLRYGNLPENVVFSLERVNSESRRMGALVEQLLLLADLDGDPTSARKEVDLAELMLTSASDVAVAHPGHRWSVDTPDARVIVVGEEDGLRQMVVNLLANAAVHTPRGTAVSVRLTRRRGDGVLTVADDGPGIPAEDQATVFDRFSRGDPARARSAGTSSTGLGLAIVQAVAARHGAAVTVDSEPGRTVFTVRLPLRIGERPQRS
ncbi:sensor histidine kinase [Salininema proteolyticum]|uniref:histidine kinase n=1 Tax=Salininema proteolyticum TaxID=1607685 RepID=A0ABV8U4Z1_9ACTN